MLNTTKTMVSCVLALTLACGCVALVWASDAPGAKADSQQTPAQATEAEAPTLAEILATEGVSAADSNAGAVSGETGDAFAMDVDCTACHKKATKKKMLAEGYTGAIHSSMACVACHDDEAALEQAHSKNYSVKKGDRVAALSATDTNDEACFACHGNLESLAGASSDCTVLTNKNGTTVNPHELPAGHYGNMVTCGKCHKMHDTKDIETSAANACLGCHHDNVYECGTCHA